MSGIATVKESMFLLGTGIKFAAGDAVFWWDATNQPNWETEGLVFIAKSAAYESSMLVTKDELEIMGETQ